MNGINLSVDKVLNIAKTATTLKIKLPASGETLTKTMLLTKKHKVIEKLFEKNFGKMDRVSQCRSQEKRKAFSMANVKTVNHNALLLKRFLCVFAINPNLLKNSQNIKELLMYGTIAA